MESLIYSTLWIVMGCTEERVFEKSPPMEGERALMYCFALNAGYKKANVNILYYLTPVWDC